MPIEASAKSGLSGMPGGSAGFSTKAMMLSLLVDMHDAEAGRLHARHLEAADGDVGTGVDMLAQHQFVVHLVDVVAGQDDHVFGIVVLDDVDVLVDGVGRTLIPLRLGDALAGRQDVEALVALGPQEVPAALQMADQRMRLVLGRHADAANAGIQRVGQREVDDARLAAEIDRGLGAPVGQFLQPAAAPAGQHIGHGVTRQRLGSLGRRPFSPPRYVIRPANSSMIVDSGGSSMVAPRRPSHRLRLDRAAIALARTAIVAGIAVHDLAPLARRRQRHAITVARRRREIRR